MHLRAGANAPSGGVSCVVQGPMWTSNGCRLFCWSHPVKPGQTWPYLAVPGQTRSNLAVPGQTWPHLVKPGDVWSHLCFEVPKWLVATPANCCLAATRPVFTCPAPPPGGHQTLPRLHAVVSKCRAVVCARSLPSPPAAFSSCLTLCSLALLTCATNIGDCCVGCLWPVG